MANHLLDGYLTEAELLAELRVSISTLHRWRKKGEGPPKTKIGARTYYHRAAVDKWMGKPVQKVG
jgi:predicted DNA-binding transcriptional regulator AlpA